MKNTDLYRYEGWDEVVINPEDFQYVHLIEDFISAEDLEKIQLFCSTAEYTESSPLYPIESIHTCVDGYETETTEILRKYRNKIYPILEQTYNCSINPESGHSEIVHIARYRPGTRLNEHADKVCESWRDLSNVLYFNDDYEGGEIYFTQYGKEFKPKAGSLLIFPAAANFSHGVREITSGYRLATSTFWVVSEWKDMDYSNWESYLPVSAVEDQSHNA
jgi:hypothetical protein